MSEQEPLKVALPPGLDLPPDPLEVRLDIHSACIRMQTFKNGLVSTKLVSADDVSHALTREIAVSSGLLPRDALWWSNTARGAVVAIWREPQATRVALQEEYGKPPLRWRIPTPGLIFLCQQGHAPWVYAARQRPTNAQETVYKAPFFNIYSNGKVCSGSHKWPLDASEVPDSFFRSFFSQEADIQGRSKEYPKDLKKRWETLDYAESYPLGDLVPHGSVGDLMNMEVL